MDLVANHNLPDPIIDPVSGLAINHPVTLQNYPGWWEDQPALYKHILELREKYGVQVDDGIEEWKAEVERANAEFKP